jgi:hypothetical protein
MYKIAIDPVPGAGAETPVKQQPNICCLSADSRYNDMSEFSGVVQPCQILNIILSPLLFRSWVGIAIQINCDNVRFQEHQKPCDILNFHSNICHDHHYRYHFSDKNAKKGKSP